ncbi:ATP-binding protein [Candidatus Curtissbacteria bacterium]|nr:ATP-binding protein [Candidatus Curtissbacteria bacterium]
MNLNSFIPKDYIERDLEKTIFDFLDNREIIVVRGPRQSGKTTLLAKIAMSLQKKSPTAHFEFVNLEDELEKQKIEKNPKQYLEFYLRDKDEAPPSLRTGYLLRSLRRERNPAEAENASHSSTISRSWFSAKADKLFFFIDEAQYIKNGGQVLKLLYDTYPQVKFVISGSSTLDLAQLGAYLVGRALFFELYPLSFAEVMRSKDKRLYQEYQARKFSFQKPGLADSLFKIELSNFLKQYLTFGGYPAVVKENEEGKKKVLLNNIFTTYIEKDISRLYGIKDKEKVLLVLKYLAETSGSVVNFNDLGQFASVYFKELKSILSILEQTYVVGKINPFHRNLVTELKKNPKYYFFDLGLRNALLHKFDFDDIELGQLLENYTFLVLKHEPLAFWRTTAKAEVDFVLKEKIIPVDVKKTPKISRSLLSFLDAYDPSLSLIVNWQEAGVISKKKTKIYSVPACLL